MTTCKIGPSILNADLGNLAGECQRMMDVGADYLHLDVMDGHFVPNMTFGHPVVKSIRTKVPNAMFDVHMMVAEPEKWIEPMHDSGVNHYTFHIEASEDPMACIRKIREAGMLVGIGLKPATSVETVLPFAEHVDTVLIMTVEPGFGGQKFMSDMMPKIQFLRDRFASLDIEVDGGVGPATIQECAEAGANMIVSGTAVVKSDDPRQTITQIRSVVDDSIQKRQLER